MLPPAEDEAKARMFFREEDKDLYAIIEPTYQSCTMPWVGQRSRRWLAVTRSPSKSWAAHRSRSQPRPERHRSSGRDRARAVRSGAICKPDKQLTCSDRRASGLIAKGAAGFCVGATGVSRCRPLWRDVQRLSSIAPARRIGGEPRPLTASPELARVAQRLTPAQQPWIIKHGVS
jgi:hypothetical protein